MAMFIEDHNVKESLLPHHKLGLSYTTTGYGDKIPTRFMAHIQGRWRRVYARCYSNVVTCYIVLNGNEVAIELP